MAESLFKYSKLQREQMPKPTHIQTYGSTCSTYTSCATETPACPPPKMALDE